MQTVSHNVMTNMTMHVLIETVVFCDSYSTDYVSSSKFVCVLSLCTPNLDFERGGCWRTHAMHDRRTAFLTNKKCQTSEGVDHSQNRQSKAHSFYFSQKSNPHQSSVGVQTTGCEPKHTFSLCACGREHHWQRVCVVKKES